MDYEDRESFSPWETYSDLYCGLLLVFVLLFFFAIYQYIDAKEKNNADTVQLQQEMKEEQAAVLALYKADLDDRTSLLEEQQILLTAQQSELEEQQTLFAIQQSGLEEQQALFAAQQSELEEQQALFAAQQSELEEQKILAASQQSELEGQKTLLEEQQTILESQRIQLEEQQTLLDAQAGQIEQIVGVRGQLIEALNNELAANQIQIEADRLTGAITVQDTILFASDSNELREEGRQFFREFMPVYLKVLLQPEFAEYIAEIIVEGHTDQSGSYLHNLELSQQRARSVAEYFFAEESDFLEVEMQEILKSLITVNGCSYKSPVYNADGTVNADRSRRVEIKFRLTDQEMIQEMDELLNKNRSQNDAG